MEGSRMIPITKYVPDQFTEDLLLETYRSGHLVQGLQVQQFETMFSDISGSKHAVAVNNGTVAIEMMLRAHDLWGCDVFVITNPLSFIATARAIEHIGAVPHFVDVDEDTGFLLQDQVDEAVRFHQDRGSTPVIMPVDLHGRFDPVTSPREGVLILRDSCQAHGIKFQGDAAAYSFHASKNATSGEGGIILTDDDNIADNLRLLRNHGMRAPYEFAYPEGFNARMTDIQAAIGIGSLRRLEVVNSIRKENAAKYTEWIEDREKLRVFSNQEIFHHYMVRHPKRNEIVTILRYEGIDARIYYPQLLTEIIEDWWENDSQNGFPNAEKICNESFAIPVHEYLTEEERDYIYETLNKVVNSVIYQ